MTLRLRTLACLAALTAPAALPLFVEVSFAPPGVRLAAEMIDGLDPGFDVLATAQIDRGIRTGQIPVRWAPDLAAGFGQPLFLFHAPAPFYLAEGFHLLGLRVVDAVKLMHLLGFLLAAGFAYLLGRDLWGAGAGWSLAALYTYAASHLAAVYLRSSLGESLAYAWPPVILWGAWRFRRDGRPAGWFAAAAGVAALALTHDRAALLLLPMLAIFVARLAVASEGRGRRLGLAGLFAAGLGASTWFWLPAMAERGHVSGAGVGPLPWGLPLAFTMALAGAAVTGLVRGRRGRVVAAVLLMSAAIGAALPHCRARYRVAIPDAGLDRTGFLSLPLPYSTASLRTEYLPSTVQRLPDQPAAEMFVPPTGCALDQERLGSDAHFFDAVCAEPGVIAFRQFAFPGWAAWVGKREVALIANPQDGTMSLAIPAGAHRVKVAFRDTPVRRGAALVALATLVATAAVWLLRGKRNSPPAGQGGT